MVNILIAVLGISAAFFAGYRVAEREALLRDRAVQDAIARTKAEYLPPPYTYKNRVELGPEFEERLRKEGQATMRLK